MTAGRKIQTASNPKGLTTSPAGTVSAPREGEIALADDPAACPPDAGLVFIGRVASPWTGREDCPKNMAAARATGRPAQIHVDPAYRPGLAGLAEFSHVVILTWLDRSRRDLIVQRPRHATGSRGTFALRSPVRPNPVGLHVARLDGVDIERGTLTLEAIDVLDGTPVIDIKPYFASADAVADARRPQDDTRGKSGDDRG